jgi:hypothetical protein
VLSLLAIGPKVRGFIPDRRRRIFKGDKNPQLALLRMGNKAFASPLPVVKFCGMLKNPTRMKEILCRRNSFPSSCSLTLLLDDSSGRISREFWLKNQGFLLPIPFNRGYPYLFITCEMAVVQRRSLTPLILTPSSTFIHESNILI